MPDSPGSEIDHLLEPGKDAQGVPTNVHTSISQLSARTKPTPKQLEALQQLPSAGKHNAPVI